MEQNKDQSGAAVRGKVDLQARLPASGPLTEVVTTIFRRARTSDTEACTFSASSVATPVAAVRGQAVDVAVGAKVIFQARSPEGDPWVDVSKADFDKARANGFETQIISGGFLAGAPVSARAADAPSEPSELLYTAVMNIPCERTMSHFVTLAEFRAYKEGHQAARHAAVNLVAAFKSRAADAPSEPSELIYRALNSLYEMTLRYAISDRDYGYVCNAASAIKAYEEGKSRAADALDSQPTESTADVQARVRDAVAANMTDLYICSRHPSAWGVGTMGLDDFSPAGEDEDVIENITDAVMATLAPASSQPTDGGVRK